MIHQNAPDARPGQGAQGYHGAHDADGLATVAGGEGLRHNGLAVGHQAGGAQRLQDPGEDQDRQGTRPCTQGRTQGKQQKAHIINPAPPEQVGQLAHNGQGGADGQQVSGQHPLDIVEGNRQLLRDGRQGHIGNAAVQRRHEGAHRNIGQHRPTADAAPCSGGTCR
ncbi:hypothetical protein D3C75_738140 [compost metagenome]